MPETGVLDEVSFMADKRIILTGGGTAGHVTPNLALVPRLRELGFEIFYIGSYDGIEKGLVEAEGIPYYGISTGKFRRYFDLKNFTDPVRVIKGFNEAASLIKKLRPDIVFSKGGFVSVPVVLAADRLHVPVICHESDMTPGLANRICIPHATRICTSFPETVASLPEGKSVHTGTPIRAALLKGDAQRGFAFTGLTPGKPVILIIGGSQGAASVNAHVREILPKLLPQFQVIHLCGKGKLEEALKGTEGYVQYEYIQDELKDLFAMSDLIISRAGANAIFELLALAKPNLLIPLSKNASRGDQILNARSFEKQGFSVVLEEEEITPDKLFSAIQNLYQNRETYIRTMQAGVLGDPVKAVIELIRETVK